MQGAVLFSAIAYTLLNIVVDVSYVFVDPRLRSDAQMNRCRPVSSSDPQIPSALDDSACGRAAAAGGWKKRTVASLVVLGLIVVSALCAPWLSPYDPLAMDPANRLPSRVSRILGGTDCLDVMSSAVCCTVGDFADHRLVCGAACGDTRSHLWLGAGYFRGAVSALVMRFMDVLFAFPGILLSAGRSSPCSAQSVERNRRRGHRQHTQLYRVVRGSAGMQARAIRAGPRSVGAKRPADHLQAISCRTCSGRWLC